MGADFSYDPVTAIDEASASGATAAIFADIRTVMSIPLVTSIWRGLAGMGDALPTTWAIARPLYESGQPEAALARVVAATDLPVPQPLAPTALACVGLQPGDLAAIRTIVAAYNRSNGMNLVALAALTAQRDNVAVPTPVATRPPPAWGAYPALLERAAIDDATWELVRHVNAFGSPGIDANVATLWRHLAHWPALLSLVHTGMAPLQASGALDDSTAQLTSLAQVEGARMAPLLPPSFTLDEAALATITGYATTPTQVVRMVTLGHALAAWLG